MIGNDNEELQEIEAMLKGKFGANVTISEEGDYDYRNFWSFGF